MIDRPKACIVYVPETAATVATVRAELETQGFTVCDAEAVGDLAGTLQEEQLPQPVVDCMKGAELCVFLLPENVADDGLIGLSAAMVGSAEIRTIGVYAGGRTSFPEALDERAESIIRVEGPNLPEAISGVPIWEKPDGQRVAEREIIRVRCQ